MQWFKRSPWELIKWCLYSPLLGLIVYFGAGLFTSSFLIQCIAGAVCALGLLLFSLFFDNVRLGLDGNGTLTYYKMGREKQAIPLAGCKTDYRHTSERVFFTSADITLSITRQQDGQAVTTNLDCSALGLARFRRLFAAIRAVTGEAAKPSALAAAPGRRRKRKADAAEDADTGPGAGAATAKGANKPAADGAPENATTGTAVTDKGNVSSGKGNAAAHSGPATPVMAAPAAEDNAGPAAKDTVDSSTKKATGKPSAKKTAKPAKEPAAMEAAEPS